jgi:hypothetical protein
MLIGRSALFTFGFLNTTTAIIIGNFYQCRLYTYNLFLNRIQSTELQIVSILLIFIWGDCDNNICKMSQDVGSYSVRRPREVCKRCNANLPFSQLVERELILWLM